MKKIVIFACCIVFSSNLFASTAESTTKIEDLDRKAEELKAYEPKIGVGFENMSTTANNLTVVNVLFENYFGIIRLGGLFGFLDTFDDVIIGPKFQVLVLQKKYLNLFGEADLYFRRGLAAGNGLGGNGLFGIELKVPQIDDLRFSFAYGIVWDVVGQNDISTTNSPVLGQVGIYYYF